MFLPAVALAAGKQEKKEERAPMSIVYGSSELTRTKFDCHFVENDKNEVWKGPSTRPFVAGSSRS